MNKKLYVGGLSRSTSEDAVREAFAQAGNVESVWLKISNDTGLPEGFGFVEMATEAEAEAAIALWHGKELDGRTLVVNEARPKVDRPRTGGGGYGSQGGNGGYNRDRRGGGGGDRRY